MKLMLETAEGVRPLADSGEEGVALVGVLPGDDIALHRLHLQETDPAERLEEARMRAIDLAAQPVEDLHIAVGPPQEDGASWIAVIDRERMAGHIEHFRAAGAAPRHFTPAALLLDAPDIRPAMARFDDDRLLLRTQDFAGLVEPGLAPQLTGTAFPPRLPQLPAFEPAAPATLPLDLMQGDFAPRLKWWKSRRFRISAALLILLLARALAAPLLIGRARAAAAIAG
ncbi:type II secretion system protein GspL, partial [Sandaracinobacter sp. RS1-74]|uniref:type II secretion system protein GspL n=1 Tax=Sandaracinobacteroides sayramensis TaxID=2913411 RepID=UPI001EDAE1E8